MRDAMTGPVGYYVDCDDAECADCFDPERWSMFEDWTEPLAIFESDESDTPTHCRVCESLIPHALTSEGYAYVADAYAEAVRNASGRRCIVRQWVEEYADGLPEPVWPLPTPYLGVVAAWPTSDDYSPGGSKDRRAS